MHSLAPTQPDSLVRQRSHRWRWLGIVLLVLFIGAVIGARLLVSHAEPILRARIIETLSTRFNSRVELAELHVSVMKGLQVSGGGLRVFGSFDPNPSQTGMQPLISVGSFGFRTTIRSLLRTPIHIDSVHVQNLVLNIPPKEERKQAPQLRPKGGKIRITVGWVVSEDAKLIINTMKPGKLPTEFDISHLVLRTIAAGQPLHFDATLVNPKPVGDIASTGYFGPFQEDSPRDTPVKGDYSFSNADLSTIKGIGGILSSTGRYGGTLGGITVDGTTDTPDFHLTRSGHPVPLHTEFHAIVDGTDGDTYLQPVKARILNSPLLANGYVVRELNPPGRHVLLDVVVNNGRIEDFLKLGVKTDPPVMTGNVSLKTKLDLPPGEQDIADRLKLISSFRVSSAHFTSEKIQAKIDKLSLRSQGKPKQATDSVPDNVRAILSGAFVLNHGVLKFSRVHFQVPGTQVDLTGIYSLDGNRFDFHGKARMDAKLSQMVGGWKSILLKPVDPFFSKHGAGTEVPIKITGTKSEPQFGLDFGHKDETPND
jgi:hypothetical protein